MQPIGPAEARDQLICAARKLATAGQDETEAGDLALEFEVAFLLAVMSRALPDVDEKAGFQKLHAQLGLLGCEDQNPGCWSPEAVAQSREWSQIRKLANAALGSAGSTGQETPEHGAAVPCSQLSQPATRTKTRFNPWGRPIPQNLSEAETFALEYAPSVRHGSADEHANDLEMILSTELARSQPDLAWHIITRVVELATREDAGYIGAGALENLLAWHPARFLPLAEELAIKSANFGEALENVWQFDMQDEYWTRLEGFRAANRHRWRS